MREAKAKATKSTAISDHDREILALESRIKELRGGRLTTVENSAILWLKRREGEALLEAALRGVSKKTYCELAGRSRKTLDEQADVYDLPLKKPEINLFEVIRTLHERVLEYAESARLSETSETRGLKEEKIRQEIRRLETQVAIFKVDLSQKNSELIPRQTVRDALQWLTGQLLQFGQQLGRRYGESLQDDWNEFLDKLAYEIESGALNL